MISFETQNVSYNTKHVCTIVYKTLEKLRIWCNVVPIITKSATPQKAISKEIEEEKTNTKAQENITREKGPHSRTKSQIELKHKQEYKIKDGKSFLFACREIVVVEDEWRWTTTPLGA